MEFFELLILLAFGLFAFLEAILLLAKPKENWQSEQKRRSKLLFSIYCTVVCGFFPISFYYLLQGSRGLSWFILFAGISCSSLYFVNSSHPWQKRIALMVILSLTIMQAIAPMIENRGIIFGPDEWRDLRVVAFIQQKGNFQGAPYFNGDFYSAIPLFNVLNAIVAEVTGWNGMITYLVFPAILELLVDLALYATLMELTKSKFLSSLAIVLSVAMPRSSSGQYIPAALGASLGAMLVLLLVKSQVDSKRKLLVVAAMVAFSVSLIHPMGMIAFFALAFGILTVGKLFPSKRLPTTKSSLIYGVFGICLLISMACWSSQAILFNGVFDPVIRFLRTLVSFNRVSSIYNTHYAAGGFDIYAFAWAIPVAAVAAYLIFSLRGIRNERSKVAFGHVFAFCAGAAGLVFVLGATASVISNPGAGVERYVNGPAYALLALATPFVFFLMFTSRKSFSVIATILLLATIIIGVYSPDNAPFEHPAFGVVRTSWVSTIEAYDIIPFLPNGSLAYSDYDIPLSQLLTWESPQTGGYFGFQPISYTLSKFKNNSIEPFDSKYAGIVFVIKTDEISNPGFFKNYFDIVYNSHRHTAIIMPNSP